VTAWDESSRNAHWRNRAPGQPFFAIFNFGVTHESQVWARANDSLWVDPDLRPPVPPYLPDTEAALTDLRRVYSNIKEMDAQVGEILAQLEADGLLDSTIVFWYSDHGGPLPRQKRLLYDSGMHLPLIIRFPDAWRAGEVDDQLISFIDFKPTLLSLAGIEPPGYVDGRAFEGPYADEEPRQYVHGAADRFDEQYDMIRAVRDERFKYLRNFQPEKPYYLPVAYREQMPIMQELLRMRDAGTLNEAQAQWFRATKEPEELFDTETDPHELNNLAGDPAYADKLAELRAECERWMEEIDDRGLMPESLFIETIWPGKVQPVTSPPVAERQDGRVTLRSETEGASIGYQRLRGSEEPGDSWEVYTEPIPLEDGERLVAVAHRLGYKPSQLSIVDGQ
jgi:arylsulfatase A-like enzyme